MLWAWRIFWFLLVSHAVEVVLVLLWLQPVGFTYTAKLLVVSIVHLFLHHCSKFASKYNNQRDLQSSATPVKEGGLDSDIEVLVACLDVLADLFHDVVCLHALREEVKELALRVDQIEHDAVVHKVVLLVLLVLVRLAVVHAVSLASCLYLLLSASQIRKVLVEVLGVELELPHRVAGGGPRR